MKDAVDRLTPLGVMLLAVLREGDMHPYEMIRLLRKRRDERLVTVTNGTVYHTVSRLEKANLLAEVGIDREGNRPERTTYTLTDAGSDAVSEWVRQELPCIDRPTEFRVAIAEAHNVDRLEATDLLHMRRRALSAALDQYRDGLATANGLGIPEQFLLEVQRQEALLQADLNWLESLIARLERHAFAWGTDAFLESHQYVQQRKAARQ